MTRVRLVAVRMQSIPEVSRSSFSGNAHSRFLPLLSDSHPPRPCVSSSAIVDIAVRRPANHEALSSTFDPIRLASNRHVSHTPSTHEDTTPGARLSRSLRTTVTSYAWSRSTLRMMERKPRRNQGRRWKGRPGRRISASRVRGTGNVRL